MAEPTVIGGDEEDYHFFYNPWNRAITVDETESHKNALRIFLTKPLYAPLLFPNNSSDARDHAANERTYLSYIRLSVYLAVVSVAILINFHLKQQPTDIERRVSRPLGLIFWVLALCCLAAGFSNYVRTVAKYARKAALVQSGLKTQIVFGVTACAIIAACGFFLGAEAQRSAMNRTRLDSLANVGAKSSVPVEELVGPRSSLQEQILKVLSDAAGGSVS